MNLFDFTYCGNYNRQIQNLSRIVPEKWSFGDSNDNGILKGYLEYTFKRVYEEGKILFHKDYAIFNTGLFNHYYQPVFAYFVPNLVPDRQEWFLDGFYTEYHLLKSGIADLPEKAEFVTNPCGHYGTKNIVPKEYFGTPKRVEYLDMLLPVPEKTEEYLKHYYGDYTKYPPQKQISKMETYTVVLEDE